MSTENTQTDAASSDVSGSNANETNAEVSSSTPVATTADAPVAAQAATDTPAQPTYTPNYKYKAALQEKEVDEFWRGLIKDADSEKKVKEALQRLDGFDYVKQSRDRIEQDFNSLKGDYQSQNQVVQKVTGAIQKKDYDSAFRQLNISDEDLFRHVQTKLQRMEMPPEQRKAFEEADRYREQFDLMQEQMNQLKGQYEQQSVQARTMQLDQVLSRPEISQAAQSWDSIQGQPGSFRDLVIQEAKTIFFQTGQDVSADQAAQIVMQKFGRVLSSQSTGQAMAPQAPAQASAQMPQSKPVIPNVSGKGAVPIKKVPRSLDDLKRLAKEAANQESQQL